MIQLTTRQYVETLELYLSNLVKSFSVPVLTPSPHTGVFTTPFTKIGSIGIHLQHRLTLHGFCLNITSDPLPYFDQVVACGLTDVSATSIEKELGKRIEVTDVVERSALAFGQEFGREIRRMDEKGDQDREWADLIRKGMEGTLDEIEIT
jgi:lipoate-protein ligase B